MTPDSLQVFDEAIARWIEAVAELHSDVQRVLRGGERESIGTGKLVSSVESARQACELAAGVHGVDIHALLSSVSVGGQSK